MHTALLVAVVSLALALGIGITPHRHGAGPIAVTSYDTNGSGPPGIVDPH